MRTAKTLLVGAAVALSLAPLTARADEEAIQGRTGLPTVKVGAEKVWMERGIVNLHVIGNDLQVTQNFRLHYPGPKLEKSPTTITVAIREQDYRSKQSKEPSITEADARGFTSFAVYVDGRRVQTSMDPWQLNDAKDTVTRWRTWDVAFPPDQVRNMQIVSRAPLGHNGTKPWINFMAKDLGHWREAPNYLEIRLTAPSNVQTRLAGLEPKPNDISSNGIRWVYRKATPDRDIFIFLPPGYNGMNRHAMR